MSDSYLVLLKAVIAALKADATLTGIVSQRIYSQVPQNATFPYVAVRIQSSPYDTKGDLGMEHLVDVSAYSRADTPLEAGNMRSAIYDILNRSESSITLDSGTLVNMIYSSVGTITKEPDGITWQAFSRFRAVVD